jgi:hypothetical protein
MIVFAVINANKPVNLESAIIRNFPEDHLKISGTEWLIAARGMTAKDVSDKLGITDGSNGSAIIFTTANYYGRAPNNVWEWLSVKLAQV